MKIIRISTNNEISIHDFPDGTYQEQNEKLRKLIGACCEIYEHVMPNRLYTELGASNKAGKIKGNCVSMLVDEEGYYHQLDKNMVGCYLYETDRHGNPILGNILIVGEVYENEGINFCGISDSQFDLIYPKLDALVKKGGNLI